MDRPRLHPYNSGCKVQSKVRLRWALMGKPDRPWPQAEANANSRAIALFVIPVPEEVSSAMFCSDMSKITGQGRPAALTGGKRRKPYNHRYHGWLVKETSGLLDDKRQRTHCTTLFGRSSAQTRKVQYRETSYNLTTNDLVQVQAPGSSCSTIAINPAHLARSARDHRKLTLNV